VEFLDIVDEHDAVVGRASHSDIYVNKHPHRIVHVLLYNTRGEMALQMRSAQKAFCPLHWCTAVGGHVQSGESYEQAAFREFHEELGMTAELTYLRKDRYDDHRGITKFLTTYTAEYDGPFEVNPEEVGRVEYFSQDTLKQMIADGEKFHPELLFLLERL